MSRFLVVAAISALAALAGCRPFAVAGEPCEGAPCAVGLACVDGLCVAAEPPPPVEPPCTSSEDCAVNGNADGRACVDGACGWADCAFDAQCGTRICDDGSCAPAVPCFDDDGCDDGQVCADGTCRAACEQDADCPSIGGFGLQACVEGECLQRCLGDQTCLGGGICVENICVEPECTVDVDCEDLGNAYCEGGRCVVFLPCAEDSDCFDPSFFCDELGRCAEYPTCRRDTECGPSALCIQDHCRPTETCGDAADAGADGGGALCGADEECVAGRCAAQPDCRAPADCAAGETCAEGACAVRVPATAHALVVGTPHGDCEATGGACRVVLFVGETFRATAQGVVDGGAPVDADVAYAEQGGPLLTLAVDARGVVVTAAAPGATTLVATAGAASVVVDVTVLPPIAYGAALGVVGPGTAHGDRKSVV